MNAIDFVIRTQSGSVERGSVGGDDQGFLINAGSGNDISLNINQTDLRGYDRAANDLLITLADGRVVVLENYFSPGGAGNAESRLFISANGTLNQVSFVEAEGGALFANYGPTASWEKWSPNDALIFVDDPQVVPQVASTYGAEDEEVSMLGAGLLGMLGTGGAVAAAASGAGLLAAVPLLANTGGDGNSGDGTPAWIAPTVDEPEASHEISGNDTPSITVTGTANPGSTVTVTVGDEVVTTTAEDDRGWEAVFEGEDFPGDGTYTDIAVSVTDPDGTVTDLDGPSFMIDTTPPAIEITQGTVSLGDLHNATGHADGVEIAGTGEAGATLTVTVGSHTETVTIDASGTWGFTFDAGVLAEGEYTTQVTLVATDAMGNSTTVTDTIQVDTVNTISLDNAPLTGDDLISASEHSAGVTLQGTSQAGAQIDVTIDGVSHAATADASGAWSVTFASGELASGTYTTTATITSVDSAGNTATMTHTFDVDTLTTVTIDTSGVAIDGVVNGSEYTSDVTVTGTAEAGATVTVVSGLITIGTTTADATGGWSMTFSPSLIEGAPGHSETGYTGTITATSTDTAGNTSSASGTVVVDTNTTVIAAFNDADGVINAVEHAGGVALAGTAEAGAGISVAVGGSTLTTTADASGAWSVTMPSGAIPQGTTTLDATVSATDAAGNTAQTTASVDIDTEISVTADTAGVEGDGVVNAAERADGVLLRGTTDANGAGSSVTVTVNGNDYAAVIASSGAWEVTIPASEVPEGETGLAVSVTAVDGAGNTATTTGTMQIDTVTNVAVMTAGVEGDGVVNEVEHADGVTLTGTAEIGATVDVTLGTVTRLATVSADGSWTVTYSAAEIPTGERTLTVTARATDLAGNTETASSTLDVDTFVRNFGITSTPGGADGVINAEEAAQGLTLTGTTEPGGTVRLTLDGQTVNATVDTSGNWTATFSAAQLPSGEVTATLTARATDPAGNIETITQAVRIDTDAGMLTISPAPVEGDDIVNAAEASDGVTLVGTSNPGQMVDVTLNGVTHTVLTDANGNWSAPFAAHEVASGTYTAQITAHITDSAGNTLTRTDSVEVDTEVLNFAVTSTPVEGDNVINAQEASNGFTLAGTTEIGGTVSVTFEGVTRAATVDGSGNWTVNFAASEIPSGEMATSALVKTVDRAGNPAETTVSFGIDTLVNALGMDTPVTADGVINAAEAAAGVTLTGDVEPGSSVSVTVGGMAHVATVDASDNWSVDIPSGSIPTGTLGAPVLIEATDAAGNVRSMTETLSVDTEAPETLNWLGYGRDGGGVDLIRTEITSDTVTLGQLTDPSGTPTVVDVPLSSVTDITAIGRSYMDLAGPVPDGTHLVLASTDAAGNTTGAFLVTDDPATATVQMSDDIANSLRAFNIDTIDLHFAEDSHLTITEAQIEALSATTDTVTVRGGADDIVTIAGATVNGTTVKDGVGFAVYELGSTTLHIEDDITQVMT